jgi:cobalt-zinc-cadmium efflux system membrane fusion protein
MTVGTENEAARVTVTTSSRRLWAWLLGGTFAVAIPFGAYSVHKHPSHAAEATAATTPTTDGTAIVLPPQFKERLKLETEAVSEVPLSPVIKVAGNVDFDPRAVAAIGTRLKGLVRNVSRFEGDVVKEGELLARIDSAELGSAQASVVMYRAQKKAAGLNYEREKDLVSRGLTTAREVEQSLATLEEYRSKLVAAEQQVSALGGGAVPENPSGAIGVYELRSPLAGTVVERHVSPGMSVEGNLTAFRVADLDHLWVQLAVFERNLVRIHVGDRVELESLAAPGAPLIGQIGHIGEAVDVTTRTTTVRVVVDNQERKLRPGQAVTAKIQVAGASTGKAVVVPTSAITFVDGKPNVFVAETDVRLVPTPVTLGESDGKNQEIVSGLSGGQVVVTGGVFALKSELFR